MQYTLCSRYRRKKIKFQNFVVATAFVSPPLEVPRNNHLCPNVLAIRVLPVLVARTNAKINVVVMGSATQILDASVTAATLEQTVLLSRLHVIRDLPLQIV